MTTPCTGALADSDCEDKSDLENDGPNEASGNANATPRCNPGLSEQTVSNIPSCTNSSPAQPQSSAQGSLPLKAQDSRKFRVGIIYRCYLEPCSLDHAPENSVAKNVMDSLFFQNLPPEDLADKSQVMRLLINEVKQTHHIKKRQHDGKKGKNKQAANMPSVKSSKMVYGIRLRNPPVVSEGDRTAFATSTRFTFGLKTLSFNDIVAETALVQSAKCNSFANRQQSSRQNAKAHVPTPATFAGVAIGIVPFTSPPAHPPSLSAGFVSPQCSSTSIPHTPLTARSQFETPSPFSGSTPLSVPPPLFIQPTQQPQHNNTQRNIAYHPAFSATPQKSYNNIRDFVEPNTWPVSDVTGERDRFISVCIDGADFTIQRALNGQVKFSGESKGLKRIHPWVFTVHPFSVSEFVFPPVVNPDPDDPAYTLVTLCVRGEESVSVTRGQIEEKKGEDVMCQCSEKVRALEQKLKETEQKVDEKNREISRLAADLNETSQRESVLVSKVADLQVLIPQRDNLFNV